MSLPIPEFKILLYGPDLPPSGVRGRARFEADRLVVQGGGRDISVAASRLSLETGGFDGRQWLVAWQGASGRMTCMLQSKEAVDAFIRLAPDEVAGQLTRTRRALGREKRHFTLGMALLLLVLALPLLLLAGFWVAAEPLAGWAAAQVSQVHEKRLGDVAFAQIHDELRLIETGPAQDAVELIGLRLSGGEPGFRYQFHLAHDDQANAFALPGGHVVVYTGLLKQMTCDDELAGVLAHEISHVRLRHSLRRLIQGLGWRVVLVAALGTGSQGWMGDLLHTLGELHYSREMEREADLGALDLLRRAGLPAGGLARFFERLTQESGQFPVLLASHPANAERLAAIRDALTEHGPYPNQSMDIDWAAVLANVADEDVK